MTGTYSTQRSDTLCGALITISESSIAREICAQVCEPHARRSKKFQYRIIRYYDPDYDAYRPGLLVITGRERSAIGNESHDVMRTFLAIACEIRQKYLDRSRTKKTSGGWGDVIRLMPHRARLFDLPPIWNINVYNLVNETSVNVPPDFPPHMRDEKMLEALVMRLSGENLKVELRVAGRDYLIHGDD